MFTLYKNPKAKHDFTLEKEAIDHKRCDQIIDTEMSVSSVVCSEQKQI